MKFASCFPLQLLFYMLKAVRSTHWQAWRSHFVLEENMLELECPAVTPEVVLKASGHVERCALPNLYCASAGLHLTEPVQFDSLKGA